MFREATVCTSVGVQRTTDLNTILLIQTPFENVLILLTKVNMYTVLFGNNIEKEGITFITGF